MATFIDNIEKNISDAVAHYWQTRKTQREKQKKRGVSDAGLRGAVTGGAQVDGFIHLFTEIIIGKRDVHKIINNSNIQP